LAPQTILFVRKIMEILKQQFNIPKEQTERERERGKNNKG